MKPVLKKSALDKNHAFSKTFGSFVPPCLLLKIFMNDVGKSRHIGKVQFSAMFRRFFEAVIFLSFLAFLDIAVKYDTIFDSYT